MSTRSLRNLSAAALLFAGLLPAAHAGATLDSLAGPVEFKFAGFSTEQNLTAGTDETTWSVGNITSITDGFNNLWSQGDDGDNLTFMIYGIADASIVPDGTGGFNIYNTGAVGGVADGKIHLDVWLDASPASIAAGPGARTGFGTYPTLTDGTLWLSLELIPGVVIDDPATLIDESLVTTMFQNADSVSSPAAGNGVFYANVTGGAAAGKFNTDSLTTLLGTTADMQGVFDFKAAPTRPGCAGGPVTPTCWENVLDDPVLAFALPEPAPVLMLGLGALLAGFASQARRKARS